MNPAQRPQRKKHRTSQPLRLIVTCLGVFACLLPAGHTQTPPAVFPSAPAVASAPVDDAVILNMAQAYRKRDTATLAALLPQASGHPLEPWAAYWDLSARLPSASSAEVDAFLQRYAGTYQEDRLRNDWLLQLGKSGDYAAFARYYPAYRMRDDHAVRCYAVLAARPLGMSATEATLLLREGWLARRDGGEACVQAATALYAQRHIGAADVWRKARESAEGAKRQSAVRSAVAIVDGAAAANVPAIYANPSQYLASASSTAPNGGELAVIALVRLASNNPDEAAALLQSTWAAQLTPAQRDWAWGAIGKHAALNLDANAPRYFSQISQLRGMPDDQLGWMARAALRAGDWTQARRAIEAMPADAQREPVWTYWLARSLQGGQQKPTQRPTQATQLLRSIASPHGFYEQLAYEELNGNILPPARPTALAGQERATARAHAGLQRALYANRLGLASEATREWNYATNLHIAGGMNDRDLLAAADLACQQQWWERCINTSERTKTHIDLAQRYPLPYRDAIVGASQQAGLDAAWVYGLIRQESRFVTQARSGVGASGLMQVMPGTARLVARKLGLPYSPASLNNLDTNVQLGTGYLRMLHSEFDGSAALASAGYNAGPGRPRNWRNGPVLEGAIWAENIPFAETRDYVKKVLANSVNYALLMGGQPQSLYGRLGQIKPAATPSADGIAVTETPLEAE